MPAREQQTPEALGAFHKPKSKSGGPSSSGRHQAGGSAGWRPINSDRQAKRLCRSGSFASFQPRANYFRTSPKLDIVGNSRHVRVGA